MVVRLVLAALLLLCLGGVEAADRPGAGLDEALAALRSADPARRARAADRLGRCGHRPECVRAARALERSVFDGDAAVRRAALSALVTLDARASAGAVAQLLAVERSPDVLPAALIALGRLGARGILRRILPFASHPDAAVRAAALTAAGDLGGAQARRLVLNGLQMAGAEDRDWLVRAAALLALARCGRPEDLPAARRAFRDGGGAGAWLARTALARLTAALDPAPGPALERWMRDDDSRVAVTAAAGLARAGLPDRLVARLRDPEARVRMAAVGGVAQVRLARAYPVLRRLARWDPVRAVRWVAALALFDVADPVGDELMLDALGAEEPAVWAQALGRLSRRTGAEHGRDADAWRRALARHRTTTEGRTAGGSDGGH